MHTIKSQSHLFHSSYLNNTKYLKCHWNLFVYLCCNENCLVLHRPTDRPRSDIQSVQTLVWASNVKRDIWKWSSFCSSCDPSSPPHPHACPPKLLSAKSSINVFYCRFNAAAAAEEEDSKTSSKKQFPNDEKRNREECEDLDLQNTFSTKE